ncbi:MAG: DNA gyrase inhibitor YacG [Gallionella sp.]|jgi:hypothetical protein|nr:DNA gyrase inhibitor YacG [Gallionella sp.]
MKPTRAPLVACPHCKKASLWDSQNPFRPFCCERCKMIDLGKWANEDYRVEQSLEPQDFLEETIIPVSFRN